MFARLILTCLCVVVCASTLTLAAATKLDADKIPQLYCGSNKSASGTSLDGDEITYFATINNITGPFSVHLYMKRVDCSPSCDPSVLSIFAADGKGSHKDHQYQLREGQTITMDVKPEAGETQFDWMWQAVAICDYGLLFNYTVVCN